MSYESRVYRILIASPSDVEDERELAVSAIQQWNDLNSFSRKIVLLPLRWETHTAPEFGTRPQEVINRAIVDQCDLLVGVFWTRLGSPTGAAESGTLEEIERAGNAGKPIMLYFSQTAIEPDRIDTNQIEKLKEFKKKTYPQALVETYRGISEFRDKFARQLELKIRDLQLSDASGELPLSLQFLSVETAELSGSVMRRQIEHQQISRLDDVPEHAREKIELAVSATVKRNASIPVPLAIVNESPSGVRNLFVELTVRASSPEVEISDTPFSRGSDDDSGFRWDYQLISRLSWRRPRSPDHVDELLNRLESKVSRFDADRFRKTDQGWQLSFDWEALQPQRIRVIKPILHIYSPKQSKITIAAKIFADSFPEPFQLEAMLNIEVEQKKVNLSDVIPKWRELTVEESKEDDDGKMVLVS